MSEDLDRFLDVPNGDASLHRKLNVWEAVGLSMALMAPSMAININPQGAAQVVGRAVPLAFLLATIGVLLIAYNFVRLSQRFSHAGSLYAFVGATVGPRAGSVAGWLTIGTYLFYGVVTSTAAGIFADDLLRRWGLWPDSPRWLPHCCAVLLLAVVWVLASRDVKRGTRLLLIVEGLTVGLVLLVATITLVKLVVGQAPRGQRFDLSVFSVSSDTQLSAVFLGVVFGFLSFAGFEAAAALGEETNRPKRDIPRAILGTAVFGGAFFAAVTAVAMMGFGTDDAGVAAFVKSEALIDDLSRQYVAAWLGDVIVVGAMVSAAACCLACVVAGSRLVFALSRDGMGPRALAAVHETWNVPHVAVGACVALVALTQVFAWAVGTAPFDLFLTSGGAGTLILLVAYALATVGTMRLLVSGNGDARAREVVIPVLGLVLLCYTLYRNVIPWQTGAELWGSALAMATLLVVVVAVLARPAAARRAGLKLMQAAGLESTSSARAEPREP